MKDKRKNNEEFPCPWKQWGNSVIATNIKYWECAYCGKQIKDGVPFQIMRINGSGTFYIFDTEFCMVMQIKKLERGRPTK